MLHALSYLSGNSAFTIIFYFINILLIKSYPIHSTPIGWIVTKKTKIVFLTNRIL